MNSIETFVYNRLSIRKEYPDTNILAAVGFIAAANIFAKLTGLKVVGSIPQYGEIVFISNHIDGLDPLRFIHACVHGVYDENGQETLGRLMRGVGKSTLFGTNEGDFVRARTGKKDILNSDHPLAKFFVRNFIGRPLRGIGLIPIRRGLVNQAATGEINSSLDSGCGIAVSLTQSRDKTGGLEGVRPGIASLLQQRPYTPYRVVAISRHPHIVRIGEQSSYAQIREEKGDMDSREFALLLADGIMDLQVEEIRNRWISEGREAEYQKLYAGRIQRAARQAAKLTSE